MNGFDSKFRVGKTDTSGNREVHAAKSNIANPPGSNFDFLHGSILS